MHIAAFIGCYWCRVGTADVLTLYSKRQGVSCNRYQELSIPIMELKVLEQGTVSAFLGWPSGFHSAWTKTYERRPPKPFLLAIKHGLDYLGWPWFEIDQSQEYSADELLALPHTEWHKAMHNVANMVETALSAKILDYSNRILRAEPRTISMMMMAKNGLIV